MVSNQTVPARTRAVRAAAILAFALTSGACAVGGRPAEAPVEDRSGQTAGPAQPDSGPRTQGVDEGWISRAPEPEPLEPGEGGAGQTETAVVALLSESDRRRRAGQPEAAAAALERALRIAPGDALLWHRLAAVRLEQRQYPQAEQLARKSLSLAGADRRLQAANWRLIGRAREALGDASGAAEAGRAAERLQP